MTCVTVMLRNLRVKYQFLSSVISEKNGHLCFHFAQRVSVIQTELFLLHQADLNVASNHHESPLRFHHSLFISITTFHYLSEDTYISFVPREQGVDGTLKLNLPFPHLAWYDQEFRCPLLRLGPDSN